MRGRLIAVAVAALFPVVAMLIYNEYSTRLERNEEVRAQAAQAARQASSELERILEGMHSLLIATSTLEVVEDQDRDPCIQALKRVTTEVASIRTIIVLDKSGRLVCDSLGSDAGLDFSDRPYVQQALKSGEYVVGGYTLSRLSSQPILPVAMPLKRDGSVIGVIVTGVRLEWLQQRVKERGVIKGNAITIADSSGIILARVPFPERFVGTRIPDNFQKLLHAPNPEVIEIKSQDGTERILGYEPISLPSNQLYVSAGISRDEAFAPINRSTISDALSIVGGAVLAIAASVLVGNRFLLRPIFQIADVMAQWRSGDRTARTGMAGSDELQQVGSALDGLLDELDQRRVEAERAEQTRSLLVHELQHRVKNTLTIIQAIARQTFRQTASAQYGAFSERIAALASGYDVLFSSDWQKGEIREVVEKALRPHQDSGESRVALQGPTVVLSAQLVLSLSLVVHELATNATKYGALHTDSGRVKIEWTAERNNVVLHWIEIDGPPVKPPTSNGFGSRLIQNAFPIEAKPKSEFSFEADGLHFELSFVCV